VRTPPVAAPTTPPPVVQETPPPPPPPAADAPTPPVTPASLTDEEISARKTLDELNAEKPLADAFFDFQEWQVREDARTSLQKNAEWLQRWPSMGVPIEGQCDARGTSEYNPALGDRRANAVRSFLISLGIAPDRLLVVSKGEEAPFCAEYGGDCWQQNRRGHFIITAM
jgi:peptidoglycan-associated lipoprotein